MTRPPRTQVHTPPDTPAEQGLTRAHPTSTHPTSAGSVDELDLKLLALMQEKPHAGVREYARRLNIARGTAHSRISKLVDRGVISSFAPHLDTAALGFGLNAYMHLTLKQADFDHVIHHIAAMPEVIQADSIAGAEDLTCQIVARDHAHLEAISLEFMHITGVERVRTDIVLRHRIPRRVAQLIPRPPRSPQPPAGRKDPS